MQTPTVRIPYHTLLCFKFLHSCIIFQLCVSGLNPPQNQLNAQGNESCAVKSVSLYAVVSWSINTGTTNWPPLHCSIVRISSYQAVEKRTRKPLLYSWCLPAPVCKSAVQQQTKNGLTCSFFYCLVKAIFSSHWSDRKIWWQTKSSSHSPKALSFPELKSSMSLMSPFSMCCTSAASVWNECVWRQLYKNRSSRKTDFQ